MSEVFYTDHLTKDINSFNKIDSTDLHMVVKLIDHVKAQEAYEALQKKLDLAVGGLKFAYKCNYYETPPNEHCDEWLPTYHEVIEQTLKDLGESDEGKGEANE